jgi:hypothetical protein
MKEEAPLGMPFYRGAKGWWLSKGGCQWIRKWEKRE